MRLSEMHTEVTPQKINRVMERSFGFTIDYDNLTYAKAQRLHQAISENMNNIRKSYGAHTVEKNAKYMELMLVREGLHKWLHSEQGLFESEMGKSEAVLAAKDIVDSIQDMLEKVSKMQNEQVPALVDTIRDQIGMEQSESFKNAIRPVLDAMYQSMQTGREQADNAARALSGDTQAAGSMDMGSGADLGSGMPGDDLGGDLGGDTMGGDLGADSDLDTDGFEATHAAAGGANDLGRGRR
jgi:hypothetical protein